MARVTVEDCLEKVRDRFELVAVAAQRAKNIAAGEPLTIDRNGEKNTVLSLREIAQGTVEVPNLQDNLVKGLQREREIDEIFGTEMRAPGKTESEAVEMMRIESEMEDMTEEQVEKQAVVELSDDLDEEDDEPQGPAEDPAEGDYSFQDEENIDD